MLEVLLEYVKTFQIDFNNTLFTARLHVMQRTV